MPSQRLTWVDATRALCVLAVVLMHATIWAAAPVDSPSAYAAGWREVVDAMGAIRMPLLFCVSGLVVAEHVRRGWTDPANRVRVVSTYYLYVVWLLVFALVLALPVRQVHPLIAGPGDLVVQLVLPGTLLWFVLALALWTAVLTTVHRVDPRLVLGVLAVLTVALAAGRPDGMARDTLYYGLYFALGVYGRGPVVATVERHGDALLVGAVPALLVAEVVHGSFPAPHGVAFAVAGVLRECAGLVAGLGLVALLGRLPVLAGWLARLGRRTLPLYVLHMPVIAALHAVPAVRQLLAQPWATAVSPVVLTAVTVASCLGAHHLLCRAGGSWLFGLPPGPRARIEGRRAVVAG